MTGSEAREQRGSRISHFGSKGPCREITDRETVKQALRKALI